MLSVRKRTNILQLVYENVQVKRPFVRKLNFNFQIYFKAHISGGQMYANMQLVTHLPVRKNILGS